MTSQPVGSVTASGPGKLPACAHNGRDRPGQLRYTMTSGTPSGRLVMFADISPHLHDRSIPAWGLEIYVGRYLGLAGCVVSRVQTIAHPELPVCDSPKYRLDPRIDLHHVEQPFVAGQVDVIPAVQGVGPGWSPGAGAGASGQGQG